MLTALLEILPLALVAAVTPIAVILSIALHETPRPVANDVAYILGGALVYVVLAVLGVIVFNGIQNFGNRGQPSTLSLKVEVALGALLIAGSAIAFRKRQGRKLPARVEKVLASVSPVKAFFLGIVVLSPGIRNLTLFFLALTFIAASNLHPVSAAILMLAFVAITLSPPAAPLVVALTRPPDRAREIIGTWSSWLERNGQLVLSLVIFLIGAKLLIQGAYGLLT
jgi:Sap, sulfolipid-1-addressing protein